MMDNQTEAVKELYEMGLIDEQVAMEQGYDPNDNVELDEEDLPEPTMMGHNLVTDEGRLVFLSNKSNTIHIAKLPEDEDGKGKAGYNWSLCNMGGKRSEAYYADKTDLSHDYLQKDGEIIGKFCGNCLKKID